jgi:hypothetical protein
VSEMLTSITLIGMATSLLMTIGCNNLLISAATWLLYLSLYAVGQTFLSFQWDILLLEVGWAAVLLAPLPGEHPFSYTACCMFLSLQPSSSSSSSIIMIISLLDAVCVALVWYTSCQPNACLHASAFVGSVSAYCSTGQQY